MLPQVVKFASFHHMHKFCQNTVHKILKCFQINSKKPTKSLIFQEKNYCSSSYSFDKNHNHFCTILPNKTLSFVKFSVALGMS